MKFTLYNKDYKNQYKLNAWQHLLSILPCNLQVFKEYANFNQWFYLMAKHCKLYLKILLTFLVPSIFLSFRLIKRAGRNKRREWWHQRGLLPSTQSNLRAEEQMLIQMKVGFSDSCPASSLYSRCWLRLMVAVYLLPRRLYASQFFFCIMANKYEAGKFQYNYE